LTIWWQFDWWRRSGGEIGAGGDKKKKEKEVSTIKLLVEVTKKK